MAKRKTSRKRGAVSMSDMPIRKLRGGIQSFAHDPDRRLADPRLIMSALLECLWDGDVAAFKEIVKSHYEAVNTAAALRKIGLSKRTFYEALSPSGNPSLETVSKIIQGLKRAA